MSYKESETRCDVCRAHIFAGDTTICAKCYDERGAELDAARDEIKNLKDEICHLSRMACAEDENAGEQPVDTSEGRGQ
jgi:hypothetical protein